MYSAHNVAIHIIDWCYDHRIYITNLKLQKLLYFVQGEVVKRRHTRLIEDDFYAWQLGPVIPNVYYRYAMYSSSALPRQPILTPLSFEDARVVDGILPQYAHLPTWELVELSHTQDPWKYNFEIFGFKSIIPFDSIKTYFEGR